MNTSKLFVCPACGASSLRTLRGLKLVKYRGIEGRIPDSAHECEHCSALLFDADDVRDNRRAWNRFKKQIDYVPLGCEIAAMRQRAGLTQRQAGDIFGGGPVAFSKYETDDIVPDEAMRNLLRLAIAYPEVVLQLEKLHDVHVKISVLDYEEPSILQSNLELGYIEDTVGEVIELAGASSMTYTKSTRAGSENGWKIQSH